MGELLRLRYGKALAADQRDQDGRFPVLGSAGRMAATNTPLTFAPVVLIGRKGNVGAVSFEPEGCWPIDTTYYAEIPAHADARFLMHQLRALDLKRLDSSTATPSLRRQDLEAQLLWIPPLLEQRRIVEILEDHLSRLDAAETGLRDVLRRLETMERAVLQRGLRGGLVSDEFSEGSALELLGDVRPLSGAGHDSDRLWGIPGGWAWARLGDLFAVKVGSTPSRADPTLWDGAVPWVSSGEVAFNRIASTRETISEAAVGNRATRLQPPGTVMLAMIGEGKTRGQAAILDVHAAHNQNCASIRVSDTKVLPEFVYAFLKERYLETRRAGSGGNQPALNKRAIQRIPVPVPPLGTQRLLVEAFREISVSTQRLRESVQAELRRGGLLRRALLASAFSGKLADRRSDQEVIEELVSV